MLLGKKLKNHCPHLHREFKVEPFLPQAESTLLTPNFNTETWAAKSSIALDYWTKYLKVRSNDADSGMLKETIAKRQPHWGMWLNMPMFTSIQQVFIDSILGYR